MTIQISSHISLDNLQQAALAALIAASGAACSPDYSDHPLLERATESPAASLSDSDIELSVKAELASQFGPMAESVDVEVQNGVAALSGAVPTLRAADRTRRVAKQIQGVRGIVDLIEVRAADRPDDEILTDVQEALLSDPATDGFDILVSVEHGTVLLEGSTDSWTEKELATSIAGGIPGVQKVINDLAVLVLHDRMDAEIAADVRRSLEWDTRINEDPIGVDVENGEVVLSGKVATLFEHDLAIERARVLGVTAVIDKLEVEPSAGNDRVRTALATPSDEELVAAIEEALEHDPRVASFDIHVAAKNGTVLLLGRVNNLTTKVAAEEDARNTLGVKHVNNSIDVAPDVSVADALLEAEVERALNIVPALERLDIQVLASAGSVRISGQVPSTFHQEWAADMVARVPGVVNVENDLRVENRGNV